MRKASPPARIWITRSEPGASRQAEDLSHSGYRCWVAPVLTIETLSPTLSETPSSQAGALPQVVIFLSEHAVRLLPESYWVLLREVAGLSTFALGATTAGALAARGLSAQVPTAGDSEGLLSLLGGMPLRGVRVTLFKGSGGRDVLSRGLRAKGVELDVVDIYRRRRLQNLELVGEIGDIGAILAASGDGLEALTPFWRRWGGHWDVPLLASSARVATMATGNGFLNAYNCAGADSGSVAAMLQGLKLRPQQ